MAKFIDEREDEVALQEDEQLESLEEEEQVEEESAEAPEQENPEQEEEEDDLPDKYRGKDVKDIIAMHQNAEHLLGKQGQEVGELRKIVDDFINSQTIKEQQKAQTTIEDIDDSAFFENPKETIQKLLDNHPSVRQSEQLAVQLKQQETLARLKAEHPDFLTIIQDPKFGEWIGKSKIRTKLLEAADKQYDYDSADELLTLWKERQENIKNAVEIEKKERKQQVKQASSGTSKGSSERPARKIYRRADIIELMRKDPERYQSLAPDIRQAYAEGRVK
jgi:hypothetical protein